MTTIYLKPFLLTMRHYFCLSSLILLTLLQGCLCIKGETETRATTARARTETTEATAKAIKTPVLNMHTNNSFSTKGWYILVKHRSKRLECCMWGILQGQIQVFDSYLGYEQNFHVNFFLFPLLGSL